MGVGWGLRRGFKKGEPFTGVWISGEAFSVRMGEVEEWFRIGLIWCSRRITPGSTWLWSLMARVAVIGTQC